MSKHKIVLQDNTTGHKFSFGLPGDVMTSDLTLLVPDKDGTILIEENINEFLTDNIIGNLRGYTGSKGDAGKSFTISKIFNSLAELLAGTTTEDTFGLVAGTLITTHVDYGKVYHRLNGSWTYVTDMSVVGAAGITGPIGYTGSKGTNGTVSAGAPSGGVDGDTWFQY